MKKIMFKQELYLSLMFGLTVIFTTASPAFGGGPTISVGKKNIVFLRGADYINHLVDHFFEADTRIIISTLKISDTQTYLMTKMYNVLRRRKEAGIKVKLIMAGKYGFGDDNASAASALRSSNIEARVYQGEELLHSKFVLIDGNEVYNGSANFTHAGLKRSEETSIYVKNKELAGRFHRYFEGLWENSIKVEKWLDSR